MDKNFHSLYFPHKNIRPIQDDMIKLIFSRIDAGKNLIVHAPTGLGKTSASLAPALKKALSNNELTIFFLTSRHTQHHLAVQTIDEIKKKFDLQFCVVDIVGKQSMCVQDHVDNLYSNEFNEYCKSIKEKGECEFYENTKEKGIKLTVKGKKVLEELKKISPSHSEKIIEVCKHERLCPYEMSAAIAKEAKVIIADYYYIFHPTISEAFFNKSHKKLEDSIIIVDEGHNLPDRIRNLFSAKISTFIIDRAKAEAKKFGLINLIEDLNQIEIVMLKLSNKISDNESESLIKKDEFNLSDKQNQEVDFDKLILAFNDAADEIREKQRSSYLGGIATFLAAWLGPEVGFTRIISQSKWKDKDLITISYKCLDPSLASTVVCEHAYSTILMSGTLKPTEMYSDLLGFPSKRTEQKEFKSPFPKKNRLNLIIPKTTTKYSQRSDFQYSEIAKICSEISNKVNGNTAIFFPSYMLMDSINNFFSNLSNKKIIREMPRLSKEAKYDMLAEFKEQSKNGGAVLLGVASGSFGEGVDLPGDLLKCVIVVGIPLQKPDLETKELIKYYDKKFGNGWDYAYLYPAILKVMQNAGRCIRSETDKGAVVFLDERYAWPHYKRCFSDSDMIVTNDYLSKIDEFFADNS